MLPESAANWYISSNLLIFSTFWHSDILVKSASLLVTATIETFLSTFCNNFFTRCCPKHPLEPKISIFLLIMFPNSCYYSFSHYLLCSIRCSIWYIIMRIRYTIWTIRCSIWDFITRIINGWLYLLFSR